MHVIVGQVAQDIVTRVVYIHAAQGNRHQFRAGGQQCLFHHGRRTELAGTGEEPGLKCFICDSQHNAC